MLLMILAVAAAPRIDKPAAPPTTEDGITVYFSPGGGCTDAIVARIEAATKPIDVQAYSFTSTAIAKAIGEAASWCQSASRPRSEQPDREIQRRDLSGEPPVPVSIDKKHAITHSKIIIIDGRTIITGSFNFTAAAENSNAENLLVIDGKPKLVAAYQQNFENHVSHAERYVSPAK